MNGEEQLVRLKLEQVLDVLRRLMTNEHMCLDDMIYAVREREGLGWDGPSVKAWSHAADDARWHFANPYPKPE